MQKLFDLAVRCVQNAISAELGFDYRNNRPFFRIHIGSKTGTGDLYQDGDKLFIETRYNKINEITDLNDLVDIAYDWYNNYSDREPFTQPDSQWVRFFEEKGLVKKVIKTEYQKNK